MTDISASGPASHPYVQLDLFRPSFSYPSSYYDEMPSLTVRQVPQHEALIFHKVNLTYRELETLVNTLFNALLNLGIRKE